jgi:hypothetical protein
VADRTEKITGAIVTFAVIGLALGSVFKPILAIPFLVLCAWFWGYEAGARAQADLEWKERNRRGL